MYLQGIKCARGNRESSNWVRDPHKFIPCPREFITLRAAQFVLKMAYFTIAIERNDDFSLVKCLPDRWKNTVWYKNEEATLLIIRLIFRTQLPPTEKRAGSRSLAIFFVIIRSFLKPAWHEKFTDVSPRSKRCVHILKNKKIIILNE